MKKYKIYDKEKKVEITHITHCKLKQGETYQIGKGIFEVREEIIENITEK